MNPTSVFSLSRLIELNRFLVLFMFYSLLSMATRAQVSSTNGNFTATTPSNLSLQTGATPTTRLTILQSNGNVGIGTTAPADLFHVNGIARANQFNAVNGIFNTTAGTTNMSFNINGANRMTLLAASGNFGIGTATPADLLHVNGNVRANQFNTVNGIFNTTAAATNMSFNTNGSNRMTLLSGGNFGIGTATPARLLTVMAASPVMNIQTSSGNDPNVRMLRFANSADTPLGSLELYGASGEFRLGTSATYFPTFYSNGLEAMRINTAGNVGIGTTTPSQKLEVAGAIYANGNASSSLTSAEGVIFKNAAASNSTGQWKLGIGTPGNYDNYFVGHMPNNSRWLLVFPSGEATFPAGAKISEDVIFSPMQHNNSFLRFNSTDKSVDLQAWQTALKFSVNSAEVARITPTGLGIGTTTPNAKLHIMGTQAEKGLYVQTNNSWIAYSDGNNYFRGNTFFADTNGNDKVGIGTLSPVTKLEVDINGTSTDLASSQYTDVGLFLKNTNATDNNLNFISYGDASGYGVVQVGAITNHTNHSGKLFFGTRNGSTVAQRMIIDELGNVGIGTATPDAKLSVKGNIHTNEVKVDLLGAVAPDYVFEPTYDLKPLAEIETYIKENKHLPEVPSAKEMEKNGVNLGEMNLLLLKKVEELTLHSIEQNKKLNEQQELIQGLINDLAKLKGAGDSEPKRKK
jgi:hypothetical protein